MTKVIEEVLKDVIQRFPKGKHTAPIKAMIEQTEPFSQEEVDKLLKKLAGHGEPADKQDALGFILKLNEAVWK